MWPVFAGTPRPDVPAGWYATRVSRLEPTVAGPRSRELPAEVAERLARSSVELAGLWGARMLSAGPLERAARLSPPALAADGPFLIEQVADALAAREWPEALPDHAAALAVRIAGCADPADAVAAVEALRALLWERLAGPAGPAPDPAAVRGLWEAGERLAEVCALLLAGMLGEIGPQERADAASGPAASPPARRVPAGGAVIVDEWVASGGGGQDAATQAAQPAGEPAAGAPHAPPAGPGTPPQAEPARAHRAEVAPPPEVEYARAEIEIRDQRSGGPAAWIGSIGHELEHFRADARPFSVLLVELDAGHGAGGSPAPAEGELERVVEEALTAHTAESPRSRRRPVVTFERPGRCWLVAGDSDPSEAERLAERLTRAAGAARTAAGPVAVNIGRASCPRDGRRAAELAAHADVDLYAARAAARGALRARR